VAEATQPKAGPKDIFLHLLAVLALYVSAGSFAALIFQYINLLYPDPLQEGYYYLTSAYSSIRWSLATLIIILPVYLWAGWFLNNMYALAPERRELKTRKWLLYFTLFAAAVIITGDLIVLIYNFLEGELTIRFFLKIITVFVIAGTVFGYYFLELREQRISSTKYFVYPIVLASAAAIVAGFFMVGSPKEERVFRFDEQRVSDLQTIQGQIVNFWQVKARLPQNLSELRDELSGFSPPQDPESNEVYGYEKTGDVRFTLCATFSRPSREKGALASKRVVPYPVDPYFTPENWQHDAGKVCFERTIDPERYPPSAVSKRALETRISDNPPD